LRFGLSAGLISGLKNGVLAIGLLLAASNPIKHWPNVLVATLAKVAAPLGFCWAASRGVFPIQAGWVILILDIIWLPALIMILWKTIQAYAGRPPSRETPFTLEEALAHYKLNSGESLYEASHEKPLAVVFLRHFGCTFTRQLMRKLEDLKNETKEHKAQLVLVHMLQHGEEHSYLPNQNVERVSDPYCELYRTFGLGKGGVLELFGPKVILQGVLALIKGCGVGHLAGDGLQLPGAFLIKDGKILESQKAKTAADLPQLEGKATRW